MSIFKGRFNVCILLLIFDIANNNRCLNEYISVWWICSVRLKIGITFIHRWWGTKRLLNLGQFFDIRVLMRLSGNSANFYWRLLHLARMLIKIAKISVIFICNFGLLVSILFYSDNLWLRFLIILTVVLVEGFLILYEIISLYSNARWLGFFINHLFS